MGERSVVFCKSEAAKLLPMAFWLAQMERSEIDDKLTIELNKDHTLAMLRLRLWRLLQTGMLTQNDLRQYPALFITTIRHYDF